MARDTIYNEAMVRVGGTVRPDQKSYIDRRWRELNMTGRSELLRWIIDEYMQREEDEDRSDANLSGADLRGADLSDANLSDANLRDADLSGAYLSDADLRRWRELGLTGRSEYMRQIIDAEIEREEGQDRE